MLFLILAFCFSLFGIDYDVIVIGTSPFSILEALYQDATGKRVLILEKEPTCGGAWRTIDICGFTRIDLGCHDIANRKELRNFLQNYLGCHLVSLQDPKCLCSDSDEGFYFAKGCSELIDCLLKKVEHSKITLKTNEYVQKIDLETNFAIVTTQNSQFTARKIIATPRTCLCSEEPKKYWHHYLLIHDLVPPQFVRKEDIDPQIMRLMNLTHFVDFLGPNLQLLVIQLSEEGMHSEEILQILWKENLLSPKATIVKSDCFHYETRCFDLEQSEQVELLDTENFDSMLQYIPKWKIALCPNF